MRRNDEITVDEAERLAPTQLVDLARARPARGRGHLDGDRASASPGRVPVLGVCLGHQAIVAVFGGEVGHGAGARARQGDARSPRRPRHLRRAARGFRRRALPLAGRDLGPRLRSRSRRRAADGEVMAVRHRELRIDGVQFHPESVLTPDRARRSAKNFLEGRLMQAAIAELLDGHDLSQRRGREA